MRLLLPILFLLASGGLFFAVINPSYTSVSQLRTDVATYNSALGNSTELQKTMDSLIEKYKNIKQEDKDRLNRFLPNTVNNIKFILEIERVANLHSMPIKDIRFEPQKAPDPSQNGGTIVIGTENSLPYGTFPIEFSTEGDYDTFVLFLKDIEHNLRLVDVKSVSFTVPAQQAQAKPTDVNPNIYSYKLKVETYWLK